VPFLGNERCWRSRSEAHERGKLIRHVRKQVPPTHDDLYRLIARVEDDTAQYHRTHPMEGEFEPGDHAEIAATAA
jgi:hypothetical protein